MAIKTYYFKNAVPTGATLHRSLQDGGTAQPAAATTTGWNAGTNAAGQSCLQNGGTEVSRNSTTPPWGTTLQPSAAPSQTLGDCWRSENKLSGTFANTNWTLSFGVRSVTAAYTGRFRLAVRIWKSTNANGTGATELTAGRVTSAITAASLSTTADTTVSITWTPGATKTLSNEYLFVQVGIEITTAGGGTTQDINFRLGSAYTLVTPDFVLASSGAFAASEAAVKDTFTSTGDVVVQGSLASTEEGSDTLSSTGEVIVKGALAASETGSDTFASTAKLIVKGGLAVSEVGSDSFAALGNVITKGSMLPHETGADTAYGSGTILVSGQLFAFETGADTFDSQGAATSGLVGDLHVNESGNDAVAASGNVYVTGLAAAAENEDHLASTGKVIIQGSGHVFELADTFDCQGSSTGGIVGDLHADESGDDGFSGSANLVVKGTLVASEVGADDFEASGKEVATGALVSTEQRDSVTSSGMVYVNGSFDLAERRDTISAPGQVKIQGSFALSEAQDALSGNGIANATFEITGEQALLLHRLHQLHGLSGQLVISQNSRKVGDFEQSISESGSTVTVTTTSTNDTLSGEVGLMIEELAALHGITAPVVVTPTSRTAGLIKQSFNTAGNTTTITRQ